MQFKLSGDFTRIKEISQKILQSLSEKQVEESFLFDVKLACEEAMINAIKYGNQYKSNKSVSIKCNITKKAIIVSVEDGGQGFNYRHIPDPTEKENLVKAGGRGLFLIRNVMDKVEFSSHGNKITMTKFFPKRGRENADKRKKS